MKEVGVALMFAGFFLMISEGECFPLANLAGLLLFIAGYKFLRGGDDGPKCNRKIYW